MQILFWVADHLKMYIMPELRNSMIRLMSGRPYIIGDEVNILMTMFLNVMIRVRPQVEIWIFPAPDIIIVQCQKAIGYMAVKAGGISILTAHILSLSGKT